MRRKNRPLATVKTAFLSLLFSLGLLFVGSGCDSRTASQPHAIRIVAGDNQLCQDDPSAMKPVIVEVVGSYRRNWLGKKQRQVMTGVRLTVRPTLAETGDNNVQLAEPAEGTTDAGGYFRTNVKPGKHLGDQYFQVECPDYPDVKPAYFRIINGVTIRGADQETLAGDNLPAPIEVELKDEDGKPLTGLPIFFSLASGDDKAQLSAQRVITDADGIASVQLQTAKSFTGTYEVIAEVGEDANSPLRTRGIAISAMALSRLTVLIGVLGGLGLFIYGMTLMSEGLQQFAGARLKNLLQLFTGNRFAAMMAGLVVTSLIQSSSACSVMVIGFVNASLLNLTQAIGILLGSAVGTTMTGQIVSFKLDGLSLPTICIGVAMALLAKKSSTKGLSKTLLGFGLLFYGMTMMSTELTVLADFPSFSRWFHLIDCSPVAGQVAPPFHTVLYAIAAGTIMTMIVQSSSASVGLAIAMANSGLINFYTAVPLILGDNIGTTITGLLAAMNTNRVSKQTAWAATIFKVIGVLLVLPLLYFSWQGYPVFLRLVDIITEGNVFAPTPENIGRHIAAAHTLFNVINVLLFLPLVSVLAAVVAFLLPTESDDKAQPRRLWTLEPHLLNMPSAALNQVLTALQDMTREAVKLTKQSVQTVTSLELSESLENELMMREEMIDEAQQSIINYLVTLTRRNLTESQSAAIPDFMHCVNDIERIGDRAINIMELSKTLSLQGDAFSTQATTEIQSIVDYIDRLSTRLLEAMSNNDLKAIEQIIDLEKEVQEMTARFEHNHESRLSNQDCTVAKGVVFVELLANLERIAAHLSNMAERAPNMLQHKVGFKSKTAATLTNVNAQPETAE